MESEDMRALWHEFALENELALQDVRVGGVDIKVGVASTNAQRTYGMQGRGFDRFHGLLFKQAEETKMAFHNRGVGHDLLVALFDADRKLVEQFRMDAHDAKIIYPLNAYQYALELPGNVADLEAETVLELEV